MTAAAVPFHRYEAGIVIATRLRRGGAPTLADSIRIARLFAASRLALRDALGWIAERRSELRSEAYATLGAAAAPLARRLKVLKKRLSGARSRAEGVDIVVAGFMSQAAQHPIFATLRADQVEALEIERKIATMENIVLSQFSVRADEVGTLALGGALDTSQNDRASTHAIFRGPRLMLGKLNDISRFGERRLADYDAETGEVSDSLVLSSWQAKEKRRLRALRIKSAQEEIAAADTSTAIAEKRQVVTLAAALAKTQTRLRVLAAAGGSGRASAADEARPRSRRPSERRGSGGGGSRAPTPPPPLAAAEGGGAATAATTATTAAAATGEAGAASAAPELRAGRRDASGGVAASAERLLRNATAASRELLAALQDAGVGGGSPIRERQRAWRRRHEEKRIAEGGVEPGSWSGTASHSLRYSPARFGPMGVIAPVAFGPAFASEQPKPRGAAGLLRPVAAPPASRPWSAVMGPSEGHRPETRAAGHAPSGARTSAGSGGVASAMAPLLSQLASSVSALSAPPSPQPAAAASPREQPPAEAPPAAAPAAAPPYAAAAAASSPPHDSSPPQPRHSEASPRKAARLYGGIDELNPGSPGHGQLVRIAKEQGMWNGSGSTLSYSYSLPKFMRPKPDPRSPYHHQQQQEQEQQQQLSESRGGGRGRASKLHRPASAGQLVFGVPARYTRPPPGGHRDVHVDARP